MAGLGYKTFTAGEVLTAANLQGYAVDQSVMVFDDSTARSSALGTAVSEGMISYLKDTNIVEQYDGTAWSGIDTTISEINAKAVNYDLTTDAGATYTLGTADANTYLQLTSAATLTVSTATDFATGDQVSVLADGTALSVTTDGATIAGAGTSTTSGTFTVGGQYEAISILCVATDEYRVIGNITAV